MSAESPLVRPLGVFGPSKVRGFEMHPDELEPLVDAIEVHLRSNIGQYLRSGVTVIALMEYTTDVLGNLFSVAGGSGVMTDGRYYWRADAAYYVESYGVAIPPDSVRHMERNGWRPPAVSDDLLAKIDAQLMVELRGSSR